MLQASVADDVALEKAGEPDGGIFDERTLLQRLMDDHQLASIVLHAFLQDIPGQLDDLRVRFGEHDESGIRFRVHTLKGAAAAVSATRLRAILEDLERSFAMSSIDDCALLAARANREFMRFRKSIERSSWWSTGPGRQKGGNL